MAAVRLVAKTHLAPNYRYALEKWSIKEMLGHVIDTERILTYRAFTFRTRPVVQRDAGSKYRRPVQTEQV